MYNTPRAATVVATSVGTLWALVRRVTANVVAIVVVGGQYVSSFCNLLLSKVYSTTAALSTSLVQRKYILHFHMC